MGREIRKVAKGWQHPKNENGHYQPMHEEYYLDAIEEWINNHRLWAEGKHPDQLRKKDPPEYNFYAEWSGNPPDVEYYRHVKWTDEEANCFQYYENVSEGTPLSPVFETLKELEDWLVENQGHSRKAAENFCKSGYAPSMVFGGGVFKTGVDSCDF